MNIITAVNYFHKTLHRRCLTGFWICVGFWICQPFEYTGVLNTPGLWICQSSEYASGSEYVRVQGSGYTKVLNMPGIHRVLNIPKSVWMTFVLHLPIVIPCLKKPILFCCCCCCCCCWLNIFASKISNLLRPYWEPRGEWAGTVNLDMPNQWYTQ